MLRSMACTSCDQCFELGVGGGVTAAGMMFPSDQVGVVLVFDVC